MRQVRVGLAERGYDILIDRDLIGRAGELIAERLRGRRLAVVADEAVAALYCEPLRESLEGAGFSVAVHRVPAGEESKSYRRLEALLEDLLAQKIMRDDALVALGGGVVGDLTGFAAAVLRRGVAFVQIPTTLLAQVDSSVGGKTAINSPHGKNLIGAFHQPALVLADTASLDSLPKRELLAGYAELVKYGLLGDRDLFDWLESNAEALIAGDDTLRAEGIARACAMKAAIVEEDERESGRRALLNLGHTFGHALEAEAGYDGRLLHGEGVAIGMLMALRLSHRLGLCAGQDVERAERHFARVGLMTRPADAGLAGVPPERLLAHMRQDKKVADGRLTFILLRGIGEAFISREVADADVLPVLAEAA